MINGCRVHVQGLHEILIFATFRSNTMGHHQWRITGSSCGLVNSTQNRTCHLRINCTDLKLPTELTIGRSSEAKLTMTRYARLILPYGILVWIFQRKGEKFVSQILDSYLQNCNAPYWYGYFFQ